MKNNSFFKLGSTNIQIGLFSKRTKSVPVIQWEDKKKVRNNYLKDPDNTIKESLGSTILIEKIIHLITREQTKKPFNPKSDSKRIKYSYPQINRNKLFEIYFPAELNKLQREGKRESNLEKKFNKRVAKGVEFHFSDGKVAHNLLTWVQCLQLASNDVIAFHLKNNDFYDWLDGIVKVPELARTCLMLTKRLQNNEIIEKDIKSEMLSELNKTALNNVIFESLIQPLLHTAIATDQKKVQDAIDKLIQIGDKRIVEPLTDKLFDSTPQIRRKIITGLGKLGDKRATPALLKILKHSTDTEDRILTVKTLGMIGDKRAVSALKEVARNKDEVGTEAVQVLERESWE